MSSDKKNREPIQYLRWHARWGPPPKEVKEAWTRKYRGVAAIGIERPWEPRSREDFELASPDDLIFLSEATQLIEKVRKETPANKTESRKQSSGESEV